MAITSDSFIRMSDGARIFYEEFGEGQPLLFIPGFMCTTKFYYRNAEELKKKYRVVLMDQRGHGRSSKTLQGNNVSRCAEDVKEVIDHLGLENVVLFGWSLGGATVAQYAKQFNEHKLAGLGLIEAVLYAFSPEPWNTHRCANFNIDGWLNAVHTWIYDPLKYHDNFCSRITETPLSEEDLAWIKPEVAKCYAHTGVEYQLDVYQTDNVSPLADRTIPVAVFAAETKAYGGIKTGREYVNRIAKAPAKLYEFFEGGHSLHLFEAEKFNKCVEEFVDEMVNGKK